MLSSSTTTVTAAKCIHVYYDGYVYAPLGAFHLETRRARRHCVLPADATLSLSLSLYRTVWQ